MAVSWNSEVNTDAYGMDTSAVDNVLRVEFESGKEKTYLKNSSVKKIFTFMLSMNDSGSNSEYKKFWDWYDNTLLSGSLSFMFPNLLTHSGTKEYLMTAVPTANGQNPKEVTISVKEV